MAKIVDCFFDEETIEGVAPESQFDESDFLVEVDEATGRENNEPGSITLTAMKSAEGGGVRQQADPGLGASLASRPTLSRGPKTHVWRQKCGIRARKRAFGAKSAESTQGARAWSRQIAGVEFHVWPKAMGLVMG